MSSAETIIVAVISSGALSAIIQCGFSIIQKNNEKHNHQNMVNQEMLLWRIKDGGKRALADGAISSEELEDINRVYKLYKSVGGNGFAETVMNKVKALPLKEQ